MQSYIIQILTMSLLCSLAEMLSPVGEREGLRRSVRLTAALCLICLMVAPLRDIGATLRSFDLGAWAAEMESGSEEDYERLMEEKLTAVGREQIKAAVCELLGDRFGIGSDECTVTVEWSEDMDGVAARHVWIALRGRAVLCDPRQIEAAIGDYLKCLCTVSVG